MSRVFVVNIMIVRLDLDRFCNYNACLIRLQPVRETREKQIQLWKELILDYCRTQKIFVIGLEQDFPLFTNPAIESKYSLLVNSQH